MMMRVEDIRNRFKDQLRNELFVTDKTGVKTIELIGASFLADEPLIFGAVNEDYVQRELEWYKSQSLFVKDIPGKTPEIWDAVSDKNGKINSNYGWAIWSKENGEQYFKVYHELAANPDSRRAVMIYNRPSMHVDYCADGMSDFMCTNAVQYLIRDGKLKVVVQMRSNDVVFGYRNDYAWQKHVADQLAEKLGIHKVEIIWNVGSLHVYERHFNLVAS